MAGKFGYCSLRAKQETQKNEIWGGNVIPKWICQMHQEIPKWESPVCENSQTWWCAKRWPKLPRLECLGLLFGQTLFSRFFVFLYWLRMFSEWKRSFKQYNWDIILDGCLPEVEEPTNPCKSWQIVEVAQRVADTSPVLSVHSRTKEGFPGRFFSS